MGVGYGTLRRLLEREIDEEALGFIKDEDKIYLGIDEHSFRHQELVHTVTEVKQRKVVGILRDDRIATLKKFLSKIPRDKVRAVCIDMKEGLRKAAEAVFPLARVVVDPFHVIADSNKRMDEARRIEQDVHQKKYERRDSQPYRYLAIRVRRQQGELFEDGVKVRHFAVVTNIWDTGGQELLEWQRGKAGTIEHIHHILNNELAGGVYPSSKHGVNATWLRLQVLTYNLLQLLKAAALPEEYATAHPKRLRFVIFTHFW